MSTADAKPPEPESKSIVQEFKEFIARGNALDLAVGVVMGAAFQKIVTSIVNDLLMPPIGLLLGGKDFSKLSVLLKEGVEKTATAEAIAPVELRYGAFINNVIEFFIIAASVFFAVKVANTLMTYRLPFIHEEAVVVEKKEEKK